MTWRRSQSCTAAEPCPVYVELTALEVIGPKVFVTGNLHTERSTLASLLVASEDGGRSWSEPAARIRTASLDQIQFIDFETGWISGQTVQGRPRDPFFLVTTDGGKSWRQRFVFDESHPGVIEQFWVAVGLIATWAMLSSAATPIRQSYINGMIPSRQRATILSFDSMLGSTGGVVVQPALGRVADTSGYATSYLYGAMITVFALPFILLSRHQHPPADRATGTPEAEGTVEAGPESDR